MQKIIILLLSLVGLASCATTKTAEKRTVMVSIEPLRYFAEQIAGDFYQVQSMVPKGMSPETYDPTPQQLVAFSKCEAFLCIGDTPFERMWIEKLAANHSSVPFYSLSEGIALLSTDEHVHVDEKGGHTHHGSTDPHIWCSVKNAYRIAENVKNAFCQLDSVHRADYEARYEKLCQLIRQTEITVDALMRGKLTSFLIYHPALTYFAHDYGIEQISIEQDGKAPSPDRVRELILHCKERGTEVLFLQAEQDERHAQVIAQELKVQQVKVDLLRYDWHEEMLLIARVLGKHASRSGQ